MVSEQEIVERLFEVYKLNRRYAEQKYGRFMLVRGQFNCLLVLDEKGTLTQKDLAAYLAIRSTSTGQLLKKLAEKGLSQKEVDPKDKRTHLISLPEAGQEEAKRMKEKRSKEHHNMRT